MTTGTLMAYAALSVRPSHLYGAEVKADPSPDSLTNPPATLPVRKFNIAAGPLGVVLSAFRTVSGVMTIVPDPAVLQIPSRGVAGILSTEMALREILAGTGLDYRFTSPAAVLLTFAGKSESLEATAAPFLPISPKFTEPLRDTPKSITVVPGEVMEEQATSTLRDALRNVAGISIAAGEGSSQGDNLTLRGFTARNDIYIDGMRDFGSYYRDPFNLEEVEVLKGPSSTEFGRGSTGGVVNQSSKWPTAESSVDANLFVGSSRTYRATADIDQPLTGIEPGAAFRLTLMGNDSGVAARDVTENRRYGVAPSLAFGLDTDTRLTLGYFHLTAHDIPDYGVPWYFNRPAPVTRSNYYGFEDGSFLDTTADMGTIRLEHDFGEAISIHEQARYARYTRDANITEPKLPTTATPQTPLDQILITRNQIAVASAETFLQNQIDATFRFTVGSVKHTVLAGVEIGRETSDPTRLTYTDVPSTSLLDPDPGQAFTGTPAISSRVDTTSRTLAAYVIDTLALSEKLDLTAGFRWDRFSTDYVQSVAPAAALSRVDSMRNWRAALVYKPTPFGSIYLDYGTSSNPSAETLSLSAANIDLSPEENRTYELGSKWDLAGNRLSLRAAVFRTEKLNAREPDPNNPLLNVLAGTQRVDGFELETSGRVTEDWRVNLSYAFLDSRLVASTYYPAAVGARLANVPENTLRIWNVVTLPRDSELGAGVNYVGSRTASATAPNDPVTGLLKEAPGYWTFDAMLRHSISPSLGMQLNVYNLANTTYYDQLHPGHIVPGAGRSALLSLAVKM